MWLRQQACGRCPASRVMSECVSCFLVSSFLVVICPGERRRPSLVGARSDGPAHPMPAARRRLCVISGAGGSAAGGAAGRSSSK